LPEALGVTGHDGDVDSAASAIGLRLTPREHALAPLQDCRDFVVAEPRHAAGMHPGRDSKGHGRDHPAWRGGTYHAACMQDVREDSARTPERTGERISDRPENEPACCKLGHIGNHRGDEVAEIQLAGLHELGDGILGAAKRTHQALSNTTSRLGPVRR